TNAIHVGFHSMERQHDRIFPPLREPGMGRVKECADIVAYVGVPIRLVDPANRGSAVTSGKALAGTSVCTRYDGGPTTQVFEENDRLLPGSSLEGNMGRFDEDVAAGGQVDYERWVAPCRTVVGGHHKPSISLTDRDDLIRQRRRARIDICPHAGGQSID